ncbi:MOSC domain-containing protein [Terriglobus aquaticus]|uniref:MOSC domain-containing protein n=1 Tax=Terriglobus aquaticus TaxID=940139 RepID=A0ABW9KHR6_9BACT|nr:MOSC domain-containing protein [Terriglobus aquaticus]
MAEPRIIAVSSSPNHGFSKQPQPAIHLLAGLGVEGDSHCGKTVQHLYLMRKDASAPNRMQVHLLPAELLDEVNADGFQVDPGGLGENILTRDVDLLHLPAGTLLRLGEEAIVELTCLRQPCAQIDRYQPGLQQRMFSHEDGKRRPRVGVMGIVTQGGIVRAQDRIRVDLPPEPHRALTT